MTQQHRILVGDCIDMIRTLPDQPVHTCITSPPCFGMRDYGVGGQIGLEVDGVDSSLGALIRKIPEPNAPHDSSYLLLPESGKRVPAPMLHLRRDTPGRRQ